MKWITACVIAVLAAAGICGCEALPFVEKPTTYQDVGVIMLEDRMVPTQIELVKGMGARIHIMEQGDRPRKVMVSGLNVEADVKPGQAALITLDRAQVEKLKGEGLVAASGKGMSRFVLVGSEGEMKPVVLGGRVEAAVVLTADGAAPKRVTVLKDTQTVVYLAKSDSDVDRDDFSSDDLGMKVTVKDREVKQMEWRPFAAGTFVFTGTVTPDSNVSFVVIDNKH